MFLQQYFLVCRAFVFMRFVFESLIFVHNNLLWNIGAYVFLFAYECGHTCCMGKKFFKTSGTCFEVQKENV